MSNPIRVLCVFSMLDRGGAESMCMNLYRHVDRSKVQFDFVKHTPKKGAFEDEIASLGGRVYEAPRYYIYNQLSYTAWWRKHLRAHPEHQIIHGHFFKISAVYFKVAQQMGRITVGHSHCTRTDKKGAKVLLGSYLVSKVAARSDVRLACSVPAGEWLYKTASFHVLNNAIDTKQYEFDPETRRQVRRELGIEENLVAGTVGRITHQKNPLGIVEIVRRTVQNNPAARFMWIGDGPMRPEVEEKIKEYGLGGSFLLMGVRPDVHRLLQAMDVFILPSFYEGLPVVAVESQAAGLPSLLSDAIAPEVEITELCRFLPLGETERWAEAICGASPDRPSTREAIIRAGYDIDTTAKWLQELYLKLQAREDVSALL